jgi:hypothetical protein
MTNVRSLARKSGFRLPDMKGVNRGSWGYPQALPPSPGGVGVFARAFVPSLQELVLSFACLRMSLVKLYYLLAGPSDVAAKARHTKLRPSYYVRTCPTAPAVIKLYQ